ncbi:haloacid dehalogenase type II [Kocuria flava]|uniref:haloacid dehalogenase type II n=1 Tax=Kocuria flava TaxID=446860 RepID=UPI001FF4415B|nr:haloacid dehalogenase type II [Kocuria flava]MCJ8503260.1 haloacid dehalogenase type II [Kocuria flava]
MTTRPDVIVFDVNETLSDMTPLGEAFAAAGAPAHLARTWFAGILRDGFAITAAGGNAAFAEIAQDSLGRLLAEAGGPITDGATGSIIAAFKGLDVHPDVHPGVPELAGLAQLVTLSNGSARVAESLLTRAGLREHFRTLLSVDDAPAWKPARAAYAYASAECGCPAGRMLLVAVHPWDIHGARRAGLRTAWLNRTGAQYPGYFDGPDLEVPDLPALAARLAELPARP